MDSQVTVILENLKNSQFSTYCVPFLFGL